MQLGKITFLPIPELMEKSLSPLPLSVMLEITWGFVCFRCLFCFCFAFVAVIYQLEEVLHDFKVNNIDKFSQIME